MLCFVHRFDVCSCCNRQRFGFRIVCIVCQTLFCLNVPDGTLGARNDATDTLAPTPEVCYNILIVDVYVVFVGGDRLLCVLRFLRFGVFFTLLAPHAFVST